jgi:hypothetical protein
VSTQINVTVGSGGLSDKARQLQTAARQAQLEKERIINLSAEALDKRVAAQAAKGLSPDGLPLYGASFKQPQIERRPAASRNPIDTYLYWFPTPPNVTTEFLTSLGGSGPYTITSADLLIYKNGRPRAPFNFRLELQNWTHTSGYSYLPTGGPFGEPAVYLQATAVPFGTFVLTNGIVSLGSQNSTTYTNLGIIKPFSEFTTELDFAVNTPFFTTSGGNNVSILDGISITDQAGENRLVVNYGVARSSDTTANLSLFVSVVNLQTNVNTVYANETIAVNPGVFVFNDANTWNRCTLVYMPSALLFFANGSLLQTVTYAFPVTIELNPTTTIKNSSVNCNNPQPKDIKVSVSSFTTKALYNANYTPRSLLR